MAGKTATVLKEYFKKGYKPTQEQFESLIDTLYEKAASILPQDNNSFNLGSSTKRWKDLFLYGKAYIASNLTALTVGNGSLREVVCEPTTVIRLSESNVQKIYVEQNCDIKFDANELIIGTARIIIQQDTIGHDVTLGGHLRVGSVSNTPNIIDILDVTCDGVEVYINVINNYRT